MEHYDNLIDFFTDLPAFNHRKWVECKIQDPVKKAIALGAVESLEQLINKDSITAQDLTKILNAVQHSSTVVSDVGSWCLMDLANEHHEI